MDLKRSVTVKLTLFLKFLNAVTFGNSNVPLTAHLSLSQSISQHHLQILHPSIHQNKLRQMSQISCNFIIAQFFCFVLQISNLSLDNIYYIFLICKNPSGLQETRGQCLRLTTVISAG